MDIQKHLDNSLTIVKSEPLVVLIGGFVVSVLNLASFGILSGPLFGGYLLMMILMLRDNRKPDFNDLLAGFSRFGQLFPFFFLTILIVIGFLFFVIPGIVMMTWWIYVLMLMADRETSLGQAMTESKAKVTEKGFFMHLVFAFMITIVPTLLINIFAAVLPPIKLLQVFLVPFQCACLASLYLEQFEGEDLMGREEVSNTFGTQSAPPPPPSGSTDNDKEPAEEPVLPPPPPEKDST